jgi:hypothetical protein
MKCLDCPLKYIGQTGRTFNVRYKGHAHAIKSNNSNSGYSNHILYTGHTCGTVRDTMDVIRTGRKGRHLNPLEKYHIYKISRTNLHMDNRHIDTHSPIFQTIHELCDRQQHVHYQKRYKSENNHIKQINTRDTLPTMESKAQREHVSTQLHTYRHNKIANCTEL